MAANYRAILADDNRIKAIIKEDLAKIRARFNDERRTELVEAEDEILLEDLIERHTALITMTHCGYIKRCDSKTYSAQNRGGKGLIGMTTKEEDFVEHVLAVDSHSYILFFTNFGRVHLKKAYEIPEASRTAKGSNIVNLLQIEQGEKITAMISVKDFVEGEYLLMVTKYGIVKRTALVEYEQHRKGGKIAINLDEGDELLCVRHTKGDESVLIATRSGLAACFDEQNARVLGRTARGVRGIRLSEGDYVVGVCTGKGDGLSLLTLTENGFGKRCSFEDFTVRGRGCKGVRCHGLSEKTGLLAGIVAVGDDDDVMLITDDGTLIRTPAAQIPTYSRTASGVIVMRLSEGASLVGVAPVARAKDEEAEEAEPPDAPIEENDALSEGENE
jgi:DNA gyrase subunit A